MIKATVQSQKEFQADEPIKVADLNKLGVPTVSISGEIETSDIGAYQVTNAKLAPETETDGVANNDGAVNNSVIAANAAIELSKLESVADAKIVAGDSSSAAKAHELLGDVTLKRARKIPFDDGGVADFTPSITSGMNVRVRGTDEVSHTGEVVKIDGSDAFYKPTSDSHGDILDNSEIHNQPNDLVYSPDGQAVTVGDTIAGAGGASGIVKAIDSSTNTLTLRSITGFFNASEALTVGGVAVGTVGASSGYEIVGYVNGASVLTDVLVSTVADAEEIGTTVRIADIKPEGTAGHVLTSNGDADAPSFQAFDVKPAVALGNFDTQHPDDLVTGDDRHYVEAQIASVDSSSYVLTSTSGDANKDFQKFRTGDEVIFTGDNSPTGASLYTIYFIRVETDTTAKLYDTEAQANAGGSGGQVPVTSIAANSVLCRYIGACGGKVGGFLFPDRSTHRDIPRRYCVVFNSAITDYVLTGSANQIYSHDAVSEDETSSEKGIIVPVKQDSSYAIFDAMYLYSDSTSYSFRYLSLLVTQY